MWTEIQVSIICRNNDPYFWRINKYGATMKFRGCFTAPLETKGDLCRQVANTDAVVRATLLEDMV